MGEVYRARDTQLNRDVAIKVLPELIAADPDRVARFTREAQTLAALNHPNIAHIHGLEDAGGSRALVMELVEGEDLSTVIARGALPLAEALPIARQIADALEAAHEAGIVHRDLKPANVKVRPDGTVKVLDFGLAKAMDSALAATSSPGPLSHGSHETPTLTHPAMTRMGMIVGTAAYMAPEQARGKAVDKRADIWAFPAQFDISASGVLAYVPGPAAAPDYSLVWVDRSGASRPITDALRRYEDLHLSPDGRRIVLTIEEPGPDVPAHVWMADAERGTLTRLTFEGYSRDPVWSPDGQSIVFGSKRGDERFGLFLQRPDGKSPAELLWQSPTPIWPDPQSWTPDGRTVVFTTKGKDTHDDIWTVSLDDRQARPWLQTPAVEWAGRLSPDGRWMAYNSTEAGRDEVYVQPFPGPGPKRLVSESGGTNPIWSRDGRELFYRRGADVFVVSVDTEAGFTVGRPTLLFSGRYRWSGRDFDVSPDGTRFVMMRNDDPRTSNTINVLVDWRQVLVTRLRGL